MKLVSKILSVGSYVPPKVVKNTDLEALMNTSDEWIIQRTGIEQRRWVDEKTSNSDLALNATNEAIEKAGIDKSEIDLIIYATLSPDHDFPGAGCFLQDKLDIPGIPTLDIRQQCSGFIYGMSVADSFIKSGQYKTILLIGSEIHSKGLWKAPEGRDVSVLFGDGAGAMIIQACENPSDSTSQILTTKLHCDGKHAKELWLPAPGCGFEGTERITKEMIDEGLIYPKMNGKAVFKHAVTKMIEVLKESMQECHVTPNDIDLYIFHQANLRINEKIAEMFQIPPEKVFNTIQKYGNTTAATIPIGLNDAMKEGVLKPGMLVASAAFGSGFTWASSIYRV